MPSDDGSPPTTPGRMRRIVGILPSPRDEALLEIGRGLRDLVRGREPLSTFQARRADRAEERWRLDRGRARLAKGDPEGALLDVAEAARLRPDSPAVSTLRQDAERSGEIRGRTIQPTLAADIEAAATHLRALGTERPTIVLYHQSSPDSPFQALLYRRAWEGGVAPIPLVDIEDLDGVPGMVPAGARVVLHLHWVNKVLHGASGTDEANARLAAFASRLDRAMAAGIQIVWTVHNVLPHDTSSPEADTALRQIIVDRAVMVHVLAAGTPELAAGLYRIPPEKVVHVPLPSFRGAYPDIVSRPAARFALRIPADATVFLLVGGLKPYKGIEIMLDAFDLAVAREPRLELLIAGSPGRSDAVDAILARAADDPRIRLHAHWVSSDDMQLFFRAADVAIMPYLRTLNSAALMTALAFDLPVIAPPVGGIVETIDPEVAVTFEPGDARSLAEAMLAARDLRPDGVRAAARRISDAHDADLISGRFVEALLGAIGQGGSPRT